MRAAQADARRPQTRGGAAGGRTFDAIEGVTVHVGGAVATAATDVYRGCADAMKAAREAKATTTRAKDGLPSETVPNGAPQQPAKAGASTEAAPGGGVGATASTCSPLDPETAAVTVVDD